VPELLDEDSSNKRAIFIVRSAHLRVYSVMHFYFDLFDLIIEAKVADQITSSNVWSATTNASNTDNAWNVNFGSGSANNNNKSNSNQVRCVRGRE
jgi:hypothetical protein